MTITDELTAPAVLKNIITAIKSYLDGLEPEVRDLIFVGCAVHFGHEVNNAKTIDAPLYTTGKT
jgi:hypothetical protein